MTYEIAYRVLDCAFLEDPTLEIPEKALDCLPSMEEHIEGLGYLPVYQELHRLFQLTNELNGCEVIPDVNGDRFHDLHDRVNPEKATTEMVILIVRSREAAWYAYRRLVANRDIEYYRHLKQLTNRVRAGEKVDIDEILEARGKSSLPWRRPLKEDELAIVKMIGLDDNRPGHRRLGTELDLYRQ